MVRMRLLRRDDGGVFPWTEVASLKPNMTEIPMDEADKIVMENMRRAGRDISDMKIDVPPQIAVIPEVPVKPVTEKEKEFLDDLKEIGTPVVPKQAVKKAK